MARGAETDTPWDESAPAAPTPGPPGAQGSLDEKIARFFDRLEQPFYILDRQWCFRFINGAAERLWSRERWGLLGKCIWDCFPEARESEPCRLHYEALDSLRPVDVQSVSPVLKRAIRLMIKPREDGVSVAFQLGGRRRILLAEDSDAVARALGTFLEDDGWSVITVPCGGTAAAAIRHLSFDCAILDEVLPQSRGSELAALPEMRATPAVIMSGYPMEFAREEGRVSYLEKPFRLHRLQEILSVAMPADAHSAD